MSITPEQAADIEKRLAAFYAWLGKRRSYPVGSAPAGMEVSNEDRTALELFKFKRDKPTRYTAYASESDNSVTTWTGEKLGDASFKQTWRDNLGSTRQHVTIVAVNGCCYWGTYYKSQGDLVRMTMRKPWPADVKVTK